MKYLALIFVLGLAGCCGKYALDDEVHRHLALQNKMNMEYRADLHARIDSLAAQVDSLKKDGQRTRWLFFNRLPSQRYQK